MINSKLFTEILTDTKQKLDNVFGRPITVADAVNRRLFWHPDVISAFQNAVNANLSCHENVMIFIKIHPAEVHSAILADDRNKDNLFYTSGVCFPVALAVICLSATVFKCANFIFPK